MGQSENPYAPTASRHKVHFPVKKTAVITLAVATALAATVLTMTSLLNRPVAPAAHQNITPPATIETIVTETPTPVVEKPSNVFKWSGYLLRYDDGKTSWKANIGEDTENAILGMTNGNLFLTKNEFFVKGAVVEEEYGHVISFGNINNSKYHFGKISFRHIENGSEASNYWLNSARVNDVLILYDVSTDNSLKDYMVIAGETAKDSVIRSAGAATGLIAQELPLIEIRELTKHGSIPVSYNPVTYVNGSATGVKAVRDSAGNVTLEIATRTRTNPDGGVSSVKLADILKLEKEAPIFGR